MPGPYLNVGIFEGPPSNIDSVQKHEEGVLRYDAGRILQYVKFGANITANDWVQGDTTQFANPFQVIQLAASVTQVPLGVAQAGGTSGSWGWITREGPATANVATTAFAGSPLRPSGTAGRLGPEWTTAPTYLGGYAVAVATGMTTGSLVNVRCL